MADFPSKRFKNDINQIGNEIDHLFMNSINSILTLPREEWNRTVYSVHINNVELKRFPGIYFTTITEMSRTPDSNLYKIVKEENKRKRKRGEDVEEDEDENENDENENEKKDV